MEQPPAAERKLSRAAFLKGAGGTLLFTVGGGVLAGCGGQPSNAGGAAGSPKPGGSATAAINSDPPTLDWMSTTADITRAISWHMFELLFAYDDDFALQPVLAEGYEASSDNLTYTIELRKNVKFHDGSTMTADDVVASMKRWGELSAGGQETAKHIKSIRPVGKSTVRVQLNGVFTPFIGHLGDPVQALAIIPAPIAEAAGKEPLTDEQLIGTGPYKFASWKRGRSIELTRFDDYSALGKERGGLAGKKTAYLDTIKANVVKDTQVRLSGLQTGQSDYAIELSPDSYDQMKSMETVKPILGKLGGWLSLIPNKAKGPFADVRLRQAANAALQKKKIAQAAYGDKDFWELDGSIFFPQQEGLYTTKGTEHYLDYDVGKAKRLMKEAGYSNEPIRILVTNLYPDHYNGGQIMAEQLKKVGFNIELEVMDWPTLVSRREQEDAYEAYITVFGGGGNFDPTSVIFFNPSYPGFYRSKKMQSLLDDWVKTTDQAKRMKLLAEINRVVYEEIPVIKIANSVELYGRSAKLLGYRHWVDMRLWNTGFASTST
ncbi:MAG: ABC transporter substrate-binding protein [Streptosporangiales bacterium]